MNNQVLGWAALRAVVALLVGAVVVSPGAASVKHAGASADIHNYYDHICGNSGCNKYRNRLMPWCKVALVEWHLGYMCSYEDSYKACLEKVQDDCIDAAIGAGVVGAASGAASGAIGAVAAGSGPVGWTALAGGAGVGAVSFAAAYFWCQRFSSVARQERGECLDTWNTQKAIQEKAFSQAESFWRQEDKDWDDNGRCDECFQ